MTRLVQQVIFGVGLGAIYALVAIGFSLIYRTVGLLSFVHPQFVMLGSVLGFSAVATFDLPIWLAFLPVALATGVLAFLIDQIGIRPIRSRGGELNPMILATVGWGIVLVNVVRLTYGSHALSYGNRTVLTLNVAGIRVRGDTLVILVIAAALMALLHVFLTRSKRGTALRAVGENPATASLMGINVERTMGLSAGVGGALGGIAGLFVGWLFVAGITAGEVGVKSLAAAVLGGFGHIPGAVAGGLIIGVLDNLVAVFLSSAWRDVVVFSLVIGVLLIRPHGLLGKARYVSS